MKICWDNLENVTYDSKRDLFIKRYPGRTFCYIYIEACENCGESFLGKKKLSKRNKNRACCKSCAVSLQHKDGHLKFYGEHNPNWRGGVSVNGDGTPNLKYNRYYSKQWGDRNPAKLNFYNAKRRALKRNQVPKNVDFEVISWYYEMSRQMSERVGIQGFYHVDHIIPLSCGGLHHEDNLQILTAKQNLSKHNKWEV